MVKSEFQTSLLTFYVIEVWKVDLELHRFGVGSPSTLTLATYTRTSLIAASLPIIQP